MRRGTVLAVAAVLVAAVAVVLVVRDALAVRAELTTVRTELRDALAAGDDAGALRSATGAARDAALRAEARVDGPLWATADVVPWVGVQTRTVGSLVAAATAATDLADQAVGVASPLLTGEFRLPVQGGAVDLEALDQLLAGADGLPVEPLAAAIELLRAAPSSSLVPELAAARREVVELGDRAVNGVRTVQELRQLVPALLGGDESRTYFLAVQNSAELRGTGGFLGFLATLGAEDGRLAVGPVAPYEVAATLEPGDPLLARRNAFEDQTRFDDPVERTEEMASRYDHVQFAGFLGNANVHPDLALTAPSLLALVERNADIRLDGIIAIDPTALELLQLAIGPLDVPDGVAQQAPRLPDPIPAGRIDEVILTEVYQQLGGATTARKEYHAGLAAAATSSVLDGDWDPSGFVRQLGQAVAERHVQVYSTHPDEQAALERLGLAGRLLPDAGTGDLLAVTANNSGANKQDALVGHRLTAAIALEDLDRDAGTVGAHRTVEVRVDNPLEPGGLDPYIAGISGQGGGAVQNHAERVLTADNRTWWSVWSPRGADFTGASDDDGAPLTLAHGTVGDVVGFDHHLLTPAGTSRSFSLDVRADAPVAVVGDEVVYRLTLWRQAKSIPDLWDLRVTAPTGWAIADARVLGGGRGTGTGPLGAGQPLVTDWSSAAFELAGTTTTDVVVELRLRSD